LKIRGAAWKDTLAIEVWRNPLHHDRTGSHADIHREQVARGRFPVTGWLERIRQMAGQE